MSAPLSLSAALQSADRRPEIFLEDKSKNIPPALAKRSLDEFVMDAREYLRDPESGEKAAKKLMQACRETHPNVDAGQNRAFSSAASDFVNFMHDEGTVAAPDNKGLPTKAVTPATDNATEQGPETNRSDVVKPNPTIQNKTINKKTGLHINKGGLHSGARKGASLHKPKGGSLHKPKGGSLHKPKGGSLHKPKGGSLHGPADEFISEP